MGYHEVGKTQSTQKLFHGDFVVLEIMITHICCRPDAVQAGVKLYVEDHFLAKWKMFSLTS